MQKPTERFTSRVENYIKYRPHYPPQVLEALRARCGLLPEWTVADIGSGTGISTELFLQNGNRVYAVEPNAAMRTAAETLLAGKQGFVSVDGTAEATTLPDASVDLVSAGQAFHWFRRQEARQEFLRILKPDGYVALFWNERRLGGTPFLEAYEKLLRDYAPEYAVVNHHNLTADVLADFFAPGECAVFECENVQHFDFEGVKGRLLSSSYAPEPGSPNYAPMIAELEHAVAAYGQDGVIAFHYDTAVYYGKLR